MSRYGWLLAALLLTGCVERRFVVTTDPPGAVVLRDNQMLGTTPADGSFVYAGKYQFTLIKDGFETLQVVQDVPARWYQYPPIDFVVENLLPFKVRDVRTFHYQMQPARQVTSGEVLPRAEELRVRGQAIIPEPPEPDPLEGYGQVGPSAKHPVPHPAKKPQPPPGTPIPELPAPRPVHATPTTDGTLPPPTRLP